MITKGKLNKITLWINKKEKRKNKEQSIDKFVVSKIKLLWQREIWMVDKTSLSRLNVDYFACSVYNWSKSSSEKILTGEP